MFVYKIHTLLYTKDMEYRISKEEIIRRKKAYITLCISLLSGLFLSSTIFKFYISAASYLSVFSALFLLGAFSFRFLRNLSRVKIILTNQLLKREVNGISENYPFNEVKRVKVKRTTNKTIREIYIWLNNGKSIFISALECPEQFKNDFLGRLTKDVVIEEVHEPVDFDHPLFYSLLGFPISGVGVLAIQSISDLNYQHTKIAMSIFIAYLSILGSYFLFAKPLSKRYEAKKSVFDYMIGILMIGSAAAILLLLFSNKWLL